MDLNILGLAERVAIKEKTIEYREEINRINEIFNKERDDEQRGLLSLLRAVVCIEFNLSLGMMSNDNMVYGSEYLKVVAEEVQKYYGDLDLSSLFNDVAILSEDTKDDILKNPAAYKRDLMGKLITTTCQAASL